MRANGAVATRTRLTSVLSCPMDLRLFPMDRQMCSLVVQSSAHPNSELTYLWADGNKTRLTFVQGLKYQDSMTPGIKLLAYRFRRTVGKGAEDGEADFDQIVVGYCYNTILLSGHLSFSVTAVLVYELFYCLVSLVHCHVSTICYFIVLSR